jgi:hypothetical protein
MVGVAVTTNATPVGVTARPDAVPTIIKLLLLLGVLGDVVTVSVAVVPVAGLGLKVPVAPDGSPLTVKFTGPVKFIRLTVMI